METIKDYHKALDKYLKERGSAWTVNNFEKAYSLEAREQIKEYLKSGPKKIKPLVINVKPIKISFCPENKDNLYCFVKYNNITNQIWFCQEGLKHLIHNYSSSRFNYEVGKDFYLAICADNLISNGGKFLYKFQYEANDTVTIEKYKRNQYGSGEIFVSQICTIDIKNMDKIRNYIKKVYCLK